MENGEWGWILVGCVTRSEKKQTHIQREREREWSKHRQKVQKPGSNQYRGTETESISPFDLSFFTSVCFYLFLFSFFLPFLLSSNLSVSFSPFLSMFLSSQSLCFQSFLLPVCFSLIPFFSFLSVVIYIFT